MGRREDKKNLQTIGLILLAIGFVTSIYPETYTPISFEGHGATITLYPYEKYSPYIIALGLIGILASFFLPVEESSQNTLKTQTSTSQTPIYQFCNYCGAPNPLDAHWCVRCGKPLPKRQN
jgi:hypothetical protein